MLLEFYYNLKKKVLVICLAGCAVGSVIGSGDYNRKEKKFQSSVWRVVLLEFYYDLKKKSSSRLSGRLCCWVSYWFWRLRPEKKVPVVCLAGCAVVKKLWHVV